MQLNTWSVSEMEWLLEVMLCMRRVSVYLMGDAQNKKTSLWAAPETIGEKTKTKMKKQQDDEVEKTEVPERHMMLSGPNYTECKSNSPCSDCRGRGTGVHHTAGERWLCLDNCCLIVQTVAPIVFKLIWLSVLLISSLSGRCHWGWIRQQKTTMHFCYVSVFFLVS